MINHLISENAIYIEETFDNKTELFKKVSQKLYENHKINDPELFFAGLIERENIITTGIGNGIGIPHTKNKSVIAPFVALVKLKTPMPYEALDNKNVDLIFIIGVGETKERLHLEILANLSRYLLEDDFLEKLRNANTIEKLYQTLKIIESEKQL